MIISPKDIYKQKGKWPPKENPRWERNGKEVVILKCVVDSKQPKIQRRREGREGGELIIAFRSGGR